MELPPDFRELLSCLNAHHVEYLLIGGYAVSAHGFTRNTGDMDIFYRLGEANTQRLAAALDEFGFAVAWTDLNRENVMFRMGVKPMMVELLSQISGLTFEAAWANHDHLSLPGDLAVPLISLSDLRANKQASGRLKDLLDLEQLPEA
jgi:hypothetical protein